MSLSGAGSGVAGDVTGPIRRAATWLIAMLSAVFAGAVPVSVEPVTARGGMVVAGHPEAAQIGAEVLRAGGNAVDAAVAVSLALGIAEPYGSGLGGKLMLLYFDAKTGKTFAVDAMDESSGALDVAEYRQCGERARYDGWSAVCVPGLAAGLFEAHRKWGARPWSDDVAPAIKLARDGFMVLPKTRELFEERIDKLRGDAELTKLFLIAGELPPAGSRLKNEELAATMQLLAEGGADAFYRGAIAAKIVAESERHGGLLTRDDFARYRPRVLAPLEISFRGMRIVGAPAPTNGSPLVLAMLKVMEDRHLKPPLRSAQNLDSLGRVWREVYPAVQQTTGDDPDATRAFEDLVSEPSIERIRAKAFGDRMAPIDGHSERAEAESVHASTTHFAVVDRWGNVVCATQSQSLHFGAGVAAAGIVMNNSMSNFSLHGESHPNFLAPGRRPRSTISPTIVLKDRRPFLAIGIPGASRIPTAVVQVLVDHLMLHRPLEGAISDTRVHWYNPLEPKQPDAVEAESSLPHEVAQELRDRGWAVSLREAAGTGRHFGGINAIAIGEDGTLIGFADPRRTNAAVGVK